jgi:hypothetical protein
MDPTAIEAAVMRGIKSNLTNIGSFSEDVQGFYHAIDWTEPWLKGASAAAPSGLAPAPRIGRIPRMMP